MGRSDKGKTGFFSESTGKEIDLKTTATDLASESLAAVVEEADKAAKELETTQGIVVNTANEFGLGLQMNTIRPIAFPQFTTKQQAYRFAAWLVLMAEMLPDETLDHSFLEIGAAISET